MIELKCECDLEDCDCSVLVNEAGHGLYEIVDKSLSYDPYFRTLVSLGTLEKLVSYLKAP